MYSLLLLDMYIYMGLMGEERVFFFFFFWIFFSSFIYFNWNLFALFEKNCDFDCNYFFSFCLLKTRVNHEFTKLWWWNWAIGLFYTMFGWFEGVSRLNERIWLIARNMERTRCPVPITLLNNSQTFQLILYRIIYWNIENTLEIFAPMPNYSIWSANTKYLEVV